MRLPGDDAPRAAATIAAAAGAGITVFDTARAYGTNERLLADSLRAAGAVTRARIVTKGGMTRAGDAWIPDGRARAIRADCEASLDALGGLPIDLHLLHAPDPRTPWATTVRALARLEREGLVRHVGLANVNRAQLDEALELAPVAAVQVAINPFDDRALRGGVLERCAELGIAVIAHSPLGGPRRAPRVARREPLAEIAAAHGATAHEIALAWLLALDPCVIAIPGARRPETARSAAAAAAIALTGDEREALDEAFGAARAGRVATTGETVPSGGIVPRGGRIVPPGEIVVIMGIPGAGKTRLARDYVARGYVRLNRDERAGSLRALAQALDEALAGGARHVVLDNTYLTRAARSHVIDAAARHGIPARCVWLDTPLAQAQINLVTRLVERFDHLPTPDELRAAARKEAGLLAPTSQMRALRELEPPSHDEGFATIDHVEFTRAAMQSPPGVFVAAAVLEAPGWEDAVSAAHPLAPHLVFDWRPDAPPGDLDAHADRLAAVVDGPVEAALCPHGAGPPVCWCRPPLPGLPIAFAARHGIDPTNATLIGTSTAHLTLANALGADLVMIRGS
jgi:aryl-alcohol dehydrogenase-like predicted oxidoreductase/predicted kinase